MTDIVERLREWKVSPLFNMADLDPTDMEEAADEIERLRQQNAELLEALRYIRKHMDLNPYGDCDMMPEFDVGVVEAAIAKATGGE